MREAYVLRDVAELEHLLDLEALVFGLLFARLVELREHLLLACAVVVLVDLVEHLALRPRPVGRVASVELERTCSQPGLLCPMTGWISTLSTSLSVLPPFAIKMRSGQMQPCMLFREARMLIIEAICMKMFA